VRVGDRVRVVLHGRRVGGWVVAVGVDPPPGVALRALAKWSGRGPTPDLIELAEWAAWRWAGRPASLLGTASPERVVARLPTAAPRRSPSSELAADREVMAALAAAGSSGVLVRLPPAAPLDPVVLAAVVPGNALILCPTAASARSVGGVLRGAGVPVARHPRDWALGAAGATVVGTRAAAWAPVAGLAAVLVIDEHDEAHRQEQAPTWHARDVALERARRAGVPCVMTSPCPSLEALDAGRLLAPSRADERAGWPVVDVIDMRRQDPRTGLLPPPLVRLLRSDRRVLCVLNRSGRARLLACRACGELARCEHCDAAVAQPGEQLVCARCGTVRPSVCASCGASRLRTLRPGVSRTRDEIAALVGEPVDEVTAASGNAAAPRSRVVVGTEATLHQIDRADAVVFLDFDQELLAPRYRAAEQALGLLARAARVVGGKAGGGRLVVQTHVPRHEVVQAALNADPTRVSSAERDRRTQLGFPPATALAEVSGAGADVFVSALGARPGIEVLGPAGGRWLVRAPDHRTLCDALAATPRPPGRLRVAVDPARV
jgi:primosomal protein N' (replication factor Y) (superfamily II helicase)